jgi:ABC-type transporter Mla subunit MlaD
MAAPIPLPLQLERDGDVFRLVDREQFLVATMEDASPDINEEQSAQIIRAVNHHDALVAALRYCLPRLHPHLVTTAKKEEFEKLLQEIDNADSI